MSDENVEVSNERLVYLKLFNKIVELEHENKWTKRMSDKQMQDKIKKLIQTLVSSKDEEE